MKKTEPMTLEEFENFVKEHSLTETARYFNCSVTTIYRKVKKYGIVTGREDNHKRVNILKEEM